MIMAKYNTNQAAYNAIKKHLLSMKERAINIESTGCAYLTQDEKTGCAIGGPLHKGMIKKDPCLKSVLKNATVGVCGLASQLPDLFYATYAPTVSKDMLHELQIVHDYRHNWDTNGLNERGKKNLEIVARKFKLNA